MQEDKWWDDEEGDEDLEEEDAAPYDDETSDMSDTERDAEITRLKARMDELTQKLDETDEQIASLEMDLEEKNIPCVLVTPREEARLVKLLTNPQLEDTDTLIARVIGRESWKKNCSDSSVSFVAVAIPLGVGKGRIIWPKKMG